MNGKKNFPLSIIIDQIIETIENFSVESKLLISENEKRIAATKLIETVSRLNTLIALQPFPFPDIILLTPIQVSMVLKISEIYEKESENKLISEIISTVLKGIVARSITKIISKFLPFISTPASLFVAHIVTQGIGMAAVRAFEGKDDFNISEIKNSIINEYNKPEVLNVFISPVRAEKSLSLVGSPNSQKDLKSIHKQVLNTFVFMPHDN